MEHMMFIYIPHIPVANPDLPSEISRSARFSTIADLLTSKTVTLVCVA